MSMNKKSSMVKKPDFFDKIFNIFYVEDEW